MNVPALDPTWRIRFVIILRWVKDWIIARIKDINALRCLLVEMLWDFKGIKVGSHSLCIDDTHSTSLSAPVLDRRRQSISSKLSERMRANQGL